MTMTSTYLEKLKLQKVQCFVDSLTGKMKELEKVFLPTRFWPPRIPHICLCPTAQSRPFAKAKECNFAYAQNSTIKLYSQLNPIIK